MGPNCYIPQGHRLVFFQCNCPVVAKLFNIAVNYFDTRNCPMSSEPNGFSFHLAKNSKLPECAGERILTYQTHTLRKLDKGQNGLQFVRKGKIIFNNLFWVDNFTFVMLTRLHSSRMRTARSLTVYPSMLCSGGWGGLFRGGGAWSRGVPSPGGAWFGEGGAWSWGGGAWSGACLVRGVVSQHALRQTPPPPPWTEFLTHASENITLPQTSFAGGNKVLISRWPCEEFKEYECGY